MNNYNDLGLPKEQVLEAMKSKLEESDKNMVHLAMTYTYWQNESATDQSIAKLNELSRSGQALAGEKSWNEHIRKTIKQYESE